MKGYSYRGAPGEGGDVRLFILLSPWRGGRCKVIHTVEPPEELTAKLNLFVVGSEAKIVDKAKQTCIQQTLTYDAFLMEKIYTSAV